jgi:hypothetical protein
MLVPQIWSWINYTPTTADPNEVGKRIYLCATTGFRKSSWSITTRPSDGAHRLLPTSSTHTDALGAAGPSSPPVSHAGSNVQRSHDPHTLSRSASPEAPAPAEPELSMILPASRVSVGDRQCLRLPPTSRAYGPGRTRTTGRTRR